MTYTVDEFVKRVDECLRNGERVIKAVICPNPRCLGTVPVIDTHGRVRSGWPDIRQCRCPDVEPVLWSDIADSHGAPRVITLVPFSYKKVD